MKSAEAEPIMAREPNEHHLRFARAVIEYVAQCYKYNQGEINSDFKMYGMERYEDFVTMTPYMVSALIQLEELSKIGFEVAKQRYEDSKRERERDADIISSIFPIR